VSVNGSFRIYSNYALTTIGGFNNLENTGGFYIYDKAALTTIGGSIRNYIKRSSRKTQKNKIHKKRYTKKN
jgi:hypothetical protein